MAIYAKKGTIELARAEKGWSCAELAREAGVSGPTVTRKEQGFPVSPATARKLADALEKPLVDLFEFRSRGRKEV
ncbi:MAG: helix-turn-helix transcriptional regulator [Desulfitobacterium sp.]